jgi:hypothetical protein
MLQQLHVNGDDDAQVYAKTIRAWLEANGGRPAGRRRGIADPALSPSLRRLKPNQMREGGGARLGRKG